MHPSLHIPLSISQKKKKRKSNYVSIIRSLYFDLFLRFLWHTIEYVKRDTRFNQLFTPNGLFSLKVKFVLLIVFQYFHFFLISLSPSLFYIDFFFFFFRMFPRDLSHNQFTGSIPESLTSSPLQLL